MADRSFLVVFTATLKGYLAGVISGVLLAVFFDKFLPCITPSETFLYKAYPNAAGIFEIIFNLDGLGIFLYRFFNCSIKPACEKLKRKIHTLKVDCIMFKISTNH